MKTRMEFNLHRLGLLLRRDLSTGYRGILAAMAAVAGSVILISAVSLTAGGSTREPHTGLFILLLFLGGFIVSSLSFRELHHSERGVSYLALPGSMLEKYASKLLLTAFGYALGTLIFYTAVAAASEGLNRAIFGTGHPFFNPFQPRLLRGVGAYLVFQSVFLAGSVFFRRLAFLKTWLFATVVAISFGAVASIISYLLFRDVIYGGISFPPQFLAEADMFTAARWFSLAGKILFWAVLAPVSWVIGYLRLQETEV